MGVLPERLIFSRTRHRNGAKRSRELIFEWPRLVVDTKMERGRTYSDSRACRPPLALATLDETHGPKLEHDEQSACAKSGRDVI